MTVANSIFLVLWLIQIQVCRNENRYCKEAVNSVKRVSSCPTSKERWDIAATKMKCTEIAQQQNCTPDSKFIFHCVINEYNDEFLEVCAPQRIILGHCVEFNIGGGVIQDKVSAVCKTTFPKCDAHYMSSDAYLYPDCYELVNRRKITQITNGIMTTQITNDMTTSMTTSISGDGNIIKFLFVGVGIFVVCFVMIAFYVYMKKRRNMSNTTSKSRKEDYKLIADKSKEMEYPMSTFGSRGKELFRRSISV